MTPPPKLNDPSLFKQNVCFVNGEFRPAKSGKTFQVNDPSSGELIGTCPEFDTADTNAAIAAAAVTSALIPGPLTVGNKLSPGVSVPRGLFLEMFLTAQLVLTVYFLAVEKHRSTYLAPLGIGTSVFLAHLCGTKYTGTSINPARSFGPAVVTAGQRGGPGFPGYHWIFWLGPFMGTLLAWSCYTILKWLEYETANPGQDAPDLELANRDAAAPTAADVHRTEKFYPKPAPPPPPPMSVPASPTSDVRPDSGISTTEIMGGMR
jgi:hypothetical protein